MVSEFFMKMMLIWSAVLCMTWAIPFATAADCGCDKRVDAKLGKEYHDVVSIGGCLVHYVFRDAAVL